MKTIPDAVYATLEPEQRVRIAIEAIARGDNKEILRLKQTCIKKSYLMTDPDYAEKMEKLDLLAIAAECDMRGAVLDFFAFSRGKEMEDMDKAEDAMSELASIAKGYGKLAEYLGVEKEAFDAAYFPRHPLVKAMILLGAREADDEAAEEYFRSMTRLLVS